MSIVEVRVGVPDLTVFRVDEAEGFAFASPTGDLAFAGPTLGDPRMWGEYDIDRQQLGPVGIY